MKLFRRTLFFVFALGLFSIPCLVVPPSFTALDLPYLGVIAIVSMLGMVAWAAIFLKTEPMLTRIGLTLVFACFSFLLFLEVMTAL